MPQVNIDGLRFYSPDNRNVLCPSWDFIVSELSIYIGQLNTAITATNTDIGEMISTVESWPTKTGTEVNNNG